MAIRVRTSGNFFILEDTDNNDLEIGRSLISQTAYVRTGERNIPAATDRVLFLRGDTGEEISSNALIKDGVLRTDLRNGDNADATFTRNSDVDAYLEPLLGSFNLAASTGPGTSISQSEIAQFTDSVYIPTNTFSLIAGSNTPIPNDGVIQANPKGITGKALTYQTNTQLFELTSGQALSGTLQITLIAPSPNTTVRLFLQVGTERAWDHTVYLRQAGAIVTQSIPFDFVASTAWDSASGQLIGFSLRAVELYNITISTNTNQ